MEVELRPGSAKRRRERRLRSMRSHEQLLLKMALACAVHHSAQRGGLYAAVQVPENVAAEYGTPAPAVYAAPVYVSTTTTPALVAADTAPALAVYTTSAPAVHAAPAPVIEDVTSAPVNEYVSPALVRADILQPPVPVVQIVQVHQVQDSQSQIIETSLKAPVLPRVWDLLPFAQ